MFIPKEQMVAHIISKRSFGATNHQRDKIFILFFNQIESRLEANLAIQKWWCYFYSFISKAITKNYIKIIIIKKKEKKNEKTHFNRRKIKGRWTTKKNQKIFKEWYKYKWKKLFIQINDGTRNVRRKKSTNKQTNSLKESKIVRKITK